MVQVMEEDRGDEDEVAIPAVTWSKLVNGLGWREVNKRISE